MSEQKKIILSLYSSLRRLNGSLTKDMVSGISLRTLSKVDEALMEADRYLDTQRKKGE